MGIRIQLMYGSPGETRETLQETVDWFKNTGIPPRRFNKLLPMPGSSNYDQCVEQGIITNEHDYLNFTSTLASYTSKHVLFNITEMSDDEYTKNLQWAESEMFKTYENNMKSDLGYWVDLILHYSKKIVQITPIINKLKKIFIANSRNRESIDIVTFMTTYYEDMLPDKNKTGFVNKPLHDERINEIFKEILNKDEQDLIVNLAPNVKTKENALNEALMEPMHDYK